MKSLVFREGELTDLEALKALFFDTISTVNSKDYSKEQIEVWRSSVENKDRWLELIDNQYVLVAETDDLIVGFITLKDSNYIDFLYVHEKHQGQKIAQQLYQKIEQKAKDNNSKSLKSDVSITARPFFKKMGFTVIKEQKIDREGIQLINYKMQKNL